MKVYEYLAGGLSVVATPLPSLRGAERPGLQLVARADFVAAVLRELDQFDEGAAADRASSVAGKSWTDRTRQAQALLAELRDRDGFVSDDDLSQ